jgi:hypothetical protein
MTHFRYAALCLATSLLAAVPAMAASSSTTAANLHLMSTNASLNQTLNSSHLSVGQNVSAHLTMKLRASNGLVLPRNTQLLGKISELQGGQGKPTSIALVFSKARLKNGRIIPIKATLLGAMPPNYNGYLSSADYFPDTSNPVAPDAAMDQEAGVLNHIALHSAVRSHNSGIFLSKRGNIRLRAGTQLRIAIAPLRNSSTQAG